MLLNFIPADQPVNWSADCFSLIVDRQKNLHIVVHPWTPPANYKTHKDLKYAAEPTHHGRCVSTQILHQPAAAKGHFLRGNYICVNNFMIHIIVSVKVNCQSYISSHFYQKHFNKLVAYTVLMSVQWYCLNACYCLFYLFFSITIV